MLNFDKANNSVWSYRYFILNKAPTGLLASHAPGTVEFVKSEIDFVINKWLPKNYDNECCWVYLRGMLCRNQEEEDRSQSTKVRRLSY